MICAVCLNPCIDKTVEIEAFTYGGMNRILSSREDGCGKGVNVALVAREMGMESCCIGYLFRDNGKLIEDRLIAAGAGSEFIWLDGKVRTNMKVFDRENRRITEINESGVKISEADQQRMIELVKKHADRCDVMVFTGSLPPGCPADFYKTLMLATEGKCRCVLDAEGEKLTRGMEALPFLIKPNQYELELRVGRELKTVQEIKEAALECARAGIGIVAVSMGGDGAFITDGKESLFAPIIPVHVRSTVGAGDSMVTGFLHGIARGEDLRGLFARGVAAGTAAVTTEGTQLLTVAQYEEMLAKVCIQDV